MRKYLTILKDKQGLAYYEACFWMVFLATVLALCLLYASLFAIIQNTQDDVRSVLDGFITSKTMELRAEGENALKVVYDSLKNGNDYTSTFTSTDTEKLERELESMLAAELNGNKLIKTDIDEYEVFTVTNYTVNFDEAYENSDNTMKLKVDYEIHIPMVFRGKLITTIKMQQKVVGYYNPKFGLIGA